MSNIKRPSVVNTAPANHAVNVNVNSNIEIEFDMELAKDSLSDSIYLYNSKEKKLSFRILYANRKVILEPKTLDTNDNYRVVIKGDEDPNNIISFKGIRNIVGNAMLGNYEFTFSTFSNTSNVEKVINCTPHNIILDDIPVLNFMTTKLTTNEVKSVNIQISTDVNFENIIWDAKKDYSQDLILNGLKPTIDMEDGTYYWRVRCINDKGNIGDWCEVNQFCISRVQDDLVVEDDSQNIDIAFNEEWNCLDPEIISSYPERNFSNVATNLKKVSVTINSIIPISQINEKSLKLSSNNISEDAYNIFHDNINGELEVYYDHSKNTTTIILNLPEIGE